MTDTRYTREKVAAMTPAKEQHHSASQIKKRTVSATRQELLDKLLELLSISRLVITPDWNYLAGDWVTSVQAADIDDDGDIEIIAGSRDGYVRALTRQGTLRWETRVGEGSWITTLAVIPSAEPPLELPPQHPDEEAAHTALPVPGGSRARIIVGTRDGKLYALDQSGKQLDHWYYEIEDGQVIHQIVIHHAHPDDVIVGGEDRAIHLLNSATGARINRYLTTGRVYSIAVADIDGDGEQEILAATTEKHILILSRQGELRGSIELAYKSYAIAVAEVDKPDPSAAEAEVAAEKASRAIIFSSFNGKDLYGWTVTNATRDLLTLRKAWPHSHSSAPAIRFQGRTHTIHIADINNDGHPEILVGSADYYLYVFDRYGQLLWKHFLGNSIYSIYACDYDNDGITEIIVGLGDNNIRALKIELDPRHEFSLQAETEPQTQPAQLPLYQQLQQVAQKLRRSGKLPPIPNDTLAEIANSLGILQDEEQKQKQGELYTANLKLKLRQYKEALALLLRLKEQGVQQYWSQPLSNLGHIRDLSFGDVGGNPIEEIIVGNDEGEAIALDINNEKEELWKSRPQLNSSIVSLQTGNLYHDDYKTTLVVLENRQICLLDHLGQPIPLSTTVLEPDDLVTSLYVSTSQKDDAHQIEHIVLGLENDKIYVYDAQLQQRLATIHTKKSISLLHAGDIMGNQQTDILAATTRHTVHLYVQEQNDPASYREQWPQPYLVGDRVRALYAADIDQDGHVEIIIGSEDRNLYVLNHLGQLKWRYFLPDAVLSVDVYDIDADQEGQKEILVGVDDGFVYIFNCQGDLRQKLPAHDRVRVVRAKELHPSTHADGMVEIAVATDDRLTLLQILHDDEIDQLIKECWRYLHNNIDQRDLLYSYGDHRREKNEYIRAFALARLAGQQKHHPEDFTLWRRAVAEDPSPIVSKALARVIVNLCKTSQPGDKNFRQSRQLLRRLTQKPQRETRIAVVDMLDELAKTNPKLSFEYLEGFLGNADLWVRHMVVRQLSRLVESHPKRVFCLLQTSAHDEHLWIRQETGRSLARYFDSQPQTLFSDLHDLLGRGIDPAVTEQIAISSQNLAISQLLEAHTRFQRAIQRRQQNLSLDKPLDSLQNSEEATTFQQQKKGYEADLAAFVAALQETMALLPQAEDMFIIYQELQNVLQVENIDDIGEFSLLTEPGEIAASRHFQYIDTLVNKLLKVVEAIKLYWKREAFSDKATTLIEANYALSQIRNQYLEERHQAQRHKEWLAKDLCPEDVLLRVALQQWYALLRQELTQLHGIAELSIELAPNDIQREETVELFFQVRNTGSSAADDVKVTISKNCNDYEIVGEAERILEEISSHSQHPQTISFTLKPRVDSFRIETTVTYNDAEKDGHRIKLGHKIDLKKSYAQFTEIPNRYNSGPPTSDASLFYGRDEDLSSLSEILSSSTTSANRVILLIGQRRTGKTSLMYQLKTKLKPHPVVFIDLQALALSETTNELFCEIAQRIQAVLLGGGFPTPQFKKSDFNENPEQALDCYLEQVTQQLAQRRLILLIDEFEVFNILIKKERLDPHFLHYLRSLMQHRLGINFLLAGAPHVLLDDLNNRSAFLNIAQHHHLSRLKREDAEKLIVDPVHLQLTYDPLALERIHYLTGDQPYLIHLLCGELIQYCNKQRKNYANTNDIKAIIETVLERGVNYFGMVWGLASSPEERLVLSIIAGDTRETQRPIFSLADLKKAFSAISCPYQTEKVRRALRHLEQEEIIETDTDGRLFTIPVGLLRIWLRKNHAPTRITREELVALKAES